MGELLTSDHVDSTSKKMIGTAGEKEGYVNKDLWSGITNLYLVATKNSEDTSACIQHFAGIPSMRKGSDPNMYSDQSGEIRKACRVLGRLHDKSQPENPQQCDVRKNNSAHSD